MLGLLTSVLAFVVVRREVRRQQTFSPSPGAVELAKVPRPVLERLSGRFSPAIENLSRLEQVIDRTLSQLQATPMV